LNEGQQRKRMSALHLRLNDVRLVRELYFTRKAYRMSAVSIARKFEIDRRTLYKWCRLTEGEMAALERQRVESTV